MLVITIIIIVAPVLHSHTPTLSDCACILQAPGGLNAMFERVTTDPDIIEK